MAAYRGSDLEIVGRTVPLNPAQADELAAVLKPAGDRHPWPDEISAGYWGRGAKKVPIVKVRPLVVAEVVADAAMQGDHYGHPLRFHCGLWVRVPRGPPKSHPCGSEPT